MDRSNDFEMGSFNDEAIDLIGKVSFTRIKSVKTTEYTGKVYDLVMDNTPNYHVSGLGVVHNGGKRKGAACVYLDSHHPDLMEFLELRDNVGEKEKRAYNLNLANWIPDLFMKRVKENGVWSFFDPSVAPELVSLYGEEYEARYMELEAEGKYASQAPAKKIFARMMRTLAETGNGWMNWKDTSNNRCNTAMTVPETHFIRLDDDRVLEFTNLDEEVKTQRGMVAIKDLVDSDDLLDY